jgi:hypothetical protein
MLEAWSYVGDSSSYPQWPGAGNDDFCLRCKYYFPPNLVDSSHPGGEEASKGSAVRILPLSLTTTLFSEKRKALKEINIRF